MLVRRLICRQQTLLTGENSMKWSLQLGRIAGIDVKVHWTFLLLLLWLGTAFLLRGDSAWAAARGVALVVSFFVCVVLHEFGHALTARRYGVGTKDITLLPIGGVARLDTIPADPRQEFWIAIAGPAVNVAIAIVLAVVMFVGRIEPTSTYESLTEAPVVQTLLNFNIVVVLFNLLPAFPMDGGRVLRALLATRTSYVRATTIAANVGQMMAILFGVVGLFINPLLIIIAFFVYLGAEAESQMVHFRAATENVRVREAMMTEFRSLAPDNLLADASRELLAGSQQDFPIIDHDKLVGVLCRQDLIDGLASAGQASAIRDFMRTAVTTADASDSLEQAMNGMKSTDCPVLPVVADGQVIGLLTLENIGELIMIRSALDHDRILSDPSRMLQRLD